MIRALALLLALTVSAKAEIETPVWPGTPKFEPLKDTPKRKPQVRGWIKHAPAKVIIKRDVVSKPEPLDEHGQCRLPVSVVGDEAKSKDAAELQSRQHWMKQVRFDYGEKFIEIGNARDVFFQCSRSDFPVTGGKIGATLDAVVHNWRCKLRATPCVTPMAREDK